MLKLDESVGTNHIFKPNFIGLSFF